MVIDSHHHFWHYDPAAYNWIDESMQVIRRDFLPEHLQTEIATVGVDGVVSVQARQSIQETEWLLELSKKHDFIKGIVGWVDLVSPAVEAQLDRFVSNPKLKSVRHVVQGEPDENFILREDFGRGIRLLSKYGLAYDLLILERHLPPTIQFVDRHPDQIFILDHVAKPRIKEHAIKAWTRNLRELARRSNVYCKISGMVTEADYAVWTEDQLHPFFDVALEAFGPKRLMFGSDWPVCVVACSYSRWFGLVSSWIRSLTLAEQARILGGTATEAYDL